MTADLYHNHVARRPAWTYLALITILAAAAALRIHRIGEPSFGIDELFSVHFATGRGPIETVLPKNQWLDRAPNLQSLSGAPPVWKIWTSLTFDTHPPLHALLLRYWMMIAGEGDSAVRMLSVVLSLLVILFLFDAAATAAGHGAGLWAAAIAAVMASQIEYAQEVRSYILLAALAAALLAVAARMLRDGIDARRSLFFATICLLMMLTHYFAVGVIVPVFVVLLVVVKQNRRDLIFSSLAAALIFAIVWGPFFLQQRSNFGTNMQWIADSAPDLLPRSLRRAAIVPLTIMFSPGSIMTNSAAGGQNMVWMAPLLIIAVPLLLGWRQKFNWLFAAATVGPIALVLLADTAQQRQMLNLIRYVLPAGIGLAALLATAGVGRRAMIRHAIPAAVVLGCFGALPQAWDRTKPPWRDYVQAATSNLTSADAVIVICNPNQVWASKIIYLAVCRYAPSLDCAVLITEDQLSEHAVLELSRRRQVIVLTEDEQLNAAAKLLPAARVVDRQFFPYAGGYVRLTLDTPPTATSPAGDR
jgi:hypothetical protein